MILVCPCGCGHVFSHNTLEERLWNQVSKGKEPDDCWEWVGTTNQKGYGYTALSSSGEKNGKKLYTHRLAYQLTYGPIPEGMHVCHKCDNPRCCRPDHLFLGTHQENMSDMVSKGRSTKKIPKKTEQKIVSQYLTGNYTYQQLADAHVISKTQVQRVIGDVGKVVVDTRPNLKRLTEQQVSEIRAHASDEKKYGLVKRLAEEYGVDRSVIYRIMHDQTYIE